MDFGAEWILECCFVIARVFQWFQVKRAQCQVKFLKD